MINMQFFVFFLAFIVITMLYVAIFEKLCYTFNNERGDTMKLVILDSDTVSTGDISFGEFAKFGSVIRYGLTEEKRVIERIRGAEIVLCNKTPITREVIESSPDLKYVGLFATGYNNVDLDSARERGIVVTNVPGYSTDGVAQLVFSFILELYGNLSRYRNSVDSGDWKKSPTFSYFPYPIFTLSGKTIGIIGYGEIGKKVSEIAKAFGMKVLVNTRTPKNDDSVSFVDLDTLLSESDIVSVHCPLNPSSEKMMNASAFGKMKNGAVFINTARGPIVDESALKDALLSGKLMGAGIDVLEREPMAEDCPLYNIKNCIITPHIAWAALETRKRLLEIAADNVSAYLSGNPKNCVL